MNDNIYLPTFFFHHTTYESTCDTLTSLAANQGDNTVSVAQGGTATPGATKQLLPPDRVFKRNVYFFYIYIHTFIYIYIYIYIYIKCSACVCVCVRVCDRIQADTNIFIVHLLGYIIIFFILKTFILKLISCKHLNIVLFFFLIEVYIYQVCEEQRETTGGVRVGRGDSSNSGGGDSNTYHFPFSLIPYSSSSSLRKKSSISCGSGSSAVISRVYALLRNRIEPKIDNILRKNQNGFRRNRSTTSQILTIRRILEGVRAKNLQATLLFVDFTKAFDSIHRGKMEQILLAYGLPKETVAAIMILYRNTKVKVRSPDGDTKYFDIVAGVLQGDTLAPYLFIICLDYVLRTSIDKIRENGFELTKRRSKRYPAKTITDADYADDLAILANTPNQAETLLHSLERAAAGIGLHVNANKTEYMCYNQTGNIATLDGASLKLVDKFTYLGSSVSSTEKDIDTRLTKAWTAIDRLSIIWKSDLTDKMKRSFFQGAVVSILLYGCTTWTLTKRLERRLDGNYTRMLRAVLNKSWRQHPTRPQLYGHFTPITKTIQVRRTRHAGHCWRSKDELISDVLLWTPTYGCARVGRPARTYIQQLCEDTGCNPEDLPEAMNDREKWRERVKDIRAGGAT